ncbi:FAD-dependent oxidoreductase [Paenibacillus cremeus]|uniref:FAD-dependent oxidoreductase n=1 Tax=Paenibacillus cremeus TaxID=2163881 RepID=A0A559K0B8_9BACL|nr:FAD-dependent oxidoreductase [Paenibacillus cremeus]TVY05602.1 FAD-dependent oxidoreductase [Paenibacillus cremeus]
MREGQEARSADVLIAGATFAGLGLAGRLGKQAVVVERTGFVGPEFTSSYCRAVIHGTAKGSAEAQALRSEAQERNLIASDGAIHSPAFVPVLHRLIQREGINVRFLTRVIQVDAQPMGGFAVTLMDGSGLSVLHVKCIVDTTGLCDTSPLTASMSPVKRRLNAMIHHPGAPEEVPPRCSGYELHRGRFPSEWMVGCELAPTDDWAAARDRLLTHWRQRPEALKPWQLATIADAFEVMVKAGTCDIASGWVWHPSAAYRDPIAAYEAGIQLALEVLTP